MKFGDEGWAAGIGDGEWLTVIGSAYDPNLVYPTPEQAHERAEKLRPVRGADVVVRRVRVEFHPGVTLTQTAYRILPEESESTHE